MNVTGACMEDAGVVSKWRNDARDTLRTTGYCTIDSQEDFIKNLDSLKHRYLSFYEGGQLVAFGGLTYIQWENRIAEISLIVDPDLGRNGYGSDAADILLDEAFNKLNLKTVFGECYKSNSATDFWFRFTGKYDGYTTVLPNRKYWNGEYYDSLYFSIDGETYCSIQQAGQPVQ
jgi:RimJ/RimL family protein N-acetyltransferase